jgi:hypothetical protein
MDKQLFDDAIGEVPPSTVDVDAAITRGRRAARLRLVANPVVAAGVAVVLLTGVVAYTMTRNDAGATVGTQPSSAPRFVETTQSPSSASGGPPAGCARPDLETPAQVIARLNPVVGTAFQALRPEVTLTGRGQFEPLKFRLSGSSLCQEGAMLTALATTHAPEGTGSVQVVVSASFADPSTLTCDGRSGPDTVCTVVTSTDGDVIRKTTGQLRHGAVGNDVEVIRPDGTAVMVTADNIGPDGPPAASTPPLTVDQLAAIGTAPGLTLFP